MSEFVPREVYERSLDCVHCGLCLNSCPTYIETGRETSSPRGRVYLMRGVAEGRIELGEVLRDEAFLCLGCRACETACPSGVEYGAMLEQTRAAVHAAGLRRDFAAKLERGLLRRVVAQRRPLHLLLSALRLAQRTGLDRLAAGLLPSGLRAAQAALPRVPPARERTRLPAFAAARGERRGRVAFFEGCVMPELFGDTNRATVDLLSANGFDVIVPEAQICCGALHAHAGDLDFARSLAQRNVEVFADEQYDAIVTNSAGCGAALRELHHWIGDAGRALSGRVRDVCEFLDEAGPRQPSGRVDGRVCYDDPCHLVHAQRVQDAPRRLLQRVPGLQLVSHADASMCCGAAGTYNLTHPEMAERVLARKLDALERVSPDWVASGNPGCMMQLAGGLRARGSKARVVHPVELLARAHAADGASDRAPSLPR